MSQTRASEPATEPPIAQRVNFSDDNRPLHIQTFFEWLSDDLHDAPLIDWTQLSSMVMTALVNSVGESPFAAPLALAAAVGRGAMKEYVLRQSLWMLNKLLRNVQHLCGVEQLTDL